MPGSDVERSAMARALELARRGPLGVNPQVGAVLLSPDGEVIAEGWHHGAGTAHAEVDALAHADPDAVRGATAIVTLEPCNHTGRTGPCAVALIEAGVARVVYAMADPTPEAGGGAERLRAAGVEVESGLLADDAHALLSSWTGLQRRGRPHVTLKWAQSLDGRAAAADGSSQWITGPTAREDVHRRRGAADAIVAGTGTVLADDPSLTARNPDGTSRDAQPQPVVIGTRDLPASLRIHAHPRELWHYRTHDLHDVLRSLGERGVHRVFVEGGPSLQSALLREGLADEILAYVAPVLLGGPRVAIQDIGVPDISAAHRLRLDEVRRLGDDLLIVLRPDTSADEAAAANDPSEGVS
ncbi:bifunctional diaminohydroxyphosphoribosylaminopyrimidine deaminase/5-amino-6-(5-phosphoribosylamino)uracil reductase RibD [Microbacterium sp. NPDC089189]|uniref:bifunctional diaminohydroxyphosphoribosylaminopyrimidine deaminase/5-amino-6-(5-phosphoribosylamino)uracil reductase RibD n=1 Tax=Microbacterium sp. NPDC089189 TaxID=3154972 RepID=UPI00342648B7